MRKIIYTAVAAAAVLAGSAAAAAPAMASNGPASVNIVTHETNVPDTTSGTVTSDNTPFGPVWAWDNVTKQFRVTSLGNGQYDVAETVHGTFSAFNEPNNPSSPVATPISVNGSIDGTNDYTVTSNAAPNGADLAPQYDDQYGNANISTGTLIKDIFGNDPSTVVGGGGTWVFTYKAHGQTMTQTYLDPTGASWGNITG